MHKKHVWDVFRVVVPRCEKRKRLMTGEEQLAALGFPCLKDIAAGSKVVPWKLNIDMFFLSSKTQDQNNMGI